MVIRRTKKHITLTGRVLTPIIAPRPFYKKSGCWVRIVGDLETERKAKPAVIGKVVKGERRAPTLLRGFRGFVKVSCVATSEERARKRIELFLSRDYLGSDTSEGFGKVQWLDCHIEDYQPKRPEERKKLKFRKGLGTNYPKELRRLIGALLLHDFVHTEKHQSKIYEQVTIKDEEIREACLNHHAEEVNENKLLSILKYYDGLASYLSRKKSFKAFSGYDHLNGKIDFKQLARRIEERQHSAYKLYQFIFQSRELQRLVESMEHGKSSLRNHLLLMVNLAINDYCNKKLVVTNGKLQIVETEKVSSSATEDEAVVCSAMDAEMHLFPTMNNADSESPSNSMTEEAWNMGGKSR